MIIGFLGKGGSGKSTLATMLVRELLAQGKRVLAIDADHNMDLSYNLTGTDLPPPHLGEAFQPIRSLFGLSDLDPISFIGETPLSFHLSPPDSFTGTYQHVISESLSVMLTGPQTEEVLNGKRCSHSLATALKLYLPHLVLKENEYVVIDEKASADAASTGIPTGFDLSVIVVENRPHSIRVAKHIAHTLDAFESPYIFVLNKSGAQEHPEIPYATYVPHNETVPLADALITAARNVSEPNSSRRTRSHAKFARQRSM